MTLFEFLSVGVSIVMALSAGQLLMNLRDVFESGRRYWVHALWVLHLLTAHVVIWWSLWAYRDMPSWNLASFGLVLLTPGLLFVCTSALVPNSSSSISSWEEHFFKVRRWFFAARILLLLVAGARTWLLLGKPVLASPTPASPLMLALLIASFLIPSPRAQGFLAVAALALFVFGVSFSRLAAGAA